MTPANPDVVQVAAAFDIGGTRIKAALLDRDLSAYAVLTVPTPRDLAADVPAVLEDTLAQLIAAADQPVEVVRAGVAIPGLVDEPNGIALLSVNLGWRDLPLAADVTARLGVPTAIGHDVRAGLLAERRIGAARGADQVLFVPLGTGIAAALMVDGRVLQAGGWAGEIGHVVVDPAGRDCPCGARGCLEVISSAAAVARTFAETAGRGASAQDVAELVDAGDSTAKAVWDNAIDALASVLATTVIATGIDRVVVGGGLVLSGETLLWPLRAALAARMTLGREVEVVASELLDRAGCLGAGVLAWDQP